MGDLLMTYKEELTKVMGELALDPKVRFIGYNTAYGHRFNGTLATAPVSACIEMPVAENLIMGVAMGMALEGYKPIVCLERMDFLWACADAIVNHLDKAKELGWPPLNVVIRTCVGTDTPLNPGCQHQGCYTTVWDEVLSFPVISLCSDMGIEEAYKTALQVGGPHMIVEYRDMYNQPTRPTVLSKSAQIE